MRNNKLIIYADGGARGNPGPAGIGVIITDEHGKIVCQIARSGEVTNNQAEYQALIAGLTKAKELGAHQIQIFLDSELIIKQLKREYKVKNKDLAPLFLEVHNLSLSFAKIIYQHINREKNRLADKLVNQAIDKAKK